MRAKTTQLSVVAVAALAVFAVAAVMLLASGGSAQATTASLDLNPGSHLPPEQGGGNPTPEPTPTRPPHKTPIATSCTYADIEVDAGHLPLFDVYWDAETQNLATSLCPSKFIYPNGPENEEERTREGFNVNVEKTIIQIDNKYKQTLGATTVENSTNRLKPPTTYGVENNRYWFLGDAGDEVWILPVCPEGELLPEGDLCIGFSAELLNREDWNDLDFEFESIREPYTDTAHEGLVYVFRHHARVDTTVEEQPVWDGSDPDENEIQVPAGEHRHRYWAFTQPGTYVLGVHVKGHPNPNPPWDPINEDHTALTSVVRRHTFHVGDRADLSIGQTDEDGNRVLGIANADTNDTTLDPGDDVVIDIQAFNDEGPDTAKNTKVDVTLPEGLTYKNHTTTIYDPQTRTWVTHPSTYDAATSVWSVGDLAVGKSPLLTITATIDDGTRGEEIKVKASIYATDDTGPVELDPHLDNNMAMATVTVRSIPNTDPTLGLMCSVPEFARPGTPVCDPLKVKEPNTSDTLTYGLIGDGAGDFAVQPLAGGKAQIVVAQNVIINYLTRESYALTLTVSDGKDSHGNADPSVDHSIDVMIQVLDFTVSWNASPTNPAVGGEVTFTITLENPPVPENELSYRFEIKSPDEADSEFLGYERTGNPGTITVASNRAETLVYRLQYFYLVGDDEKGLTQPEFITVTWAN